MRAASLCEGQESSSLYEITPEAVFQTARRGSWYSLDQPTGRPAKKHKPIKMAAKVRT